MFTGPENLVSSDGVRKLRSLICEDLLKIGGPEVCEVLGV